MRNFKPEDFSGGGHYIIRDDGPPNTIDNSGRMSTLMYKTGYSHGHGFEYNPKMGQITTLTAMSDGWTMTGHIEDGKYIQWNNKEGLCDYLNKCAQEYRFATQEEVVRVVMCQNHRWRNPE